MTAFVYLDSDLMRRLSNESQSPKRSADYEAQAKYHRSQADRATIIAGIAALGTRVPEPRIKLAAEGVAAAAAVAAALEIQRAMEAEAKAEEARKIEQEKERAEREQREQARAFEKELMQRGDRFRERYESGDFRDIMDYDPIDRGEKYA